MMENMQVASYRLQVKKTVTKYWNDGLKGIMEYWNNESTVPLGSREIIG